jgi:tetratricopeptide (TPR) repeat protein
MTTVDVLKLGLALPLGYLAAKLAPSDPASATTAATVAASLIGGAAGNFAHQALDAPTSALFASVFKTGTGVDENHTILLALRGAHLDALAEVAERAALRLDGGDRDAGFLSYRAGLDGYLGEARQKLTPAGFAMPSDAERAVFDGLPEAFSAGLSERDANAADADARDMRASVEAAVLAELCADLGEDAPASFAAAFAGSAAPGDDGWFGAFVRAASARLKDNAAFATIWTASAVARIEAALAQHERLLRDIAERMATEAAAERRHREVMAVQEKILEQVSRDKGVDPEHLRPILERLGHQDVPLSDIPRVLAAAVDQLQAMARERTAPNNDGADIDAAIARARALLASADAEGAVAELNRALDEDEVFQAAVKRRIRLLVEKAGILRAAYDHEGALVTLKEVLRLDPDQVGCHGALGDISVLLGRLGPALEHFRNGRDAAARRRDAHGLSLSLERIGDCLRARGNREGALAAYRDSNAISEQILSGDPGNAKLQMRHSISLNKVGDCLKDAGDRIAALANYRATLAIREKLAGDDLSNFGWRRSLFVSHDQIGDCLMGSGDRASAFASYRNALVIINDLHKSEPHNAGLQRDRSIALNKIGDCQADVGDYDDALTNYRAALSIAESLSAQDPSNAKWQDDVSICHESIGDCLKRSGDRDSALIAYRACFAIREALAGQDPGNIVWQRALSICHNRIGECLREKGDVGGAFNSFNAGLAVAEVLARRDPANTEWQRDLGISHCKIGDCLLDKGDRLAALASYSACIAIQRALARSDPRNTVWQCDLIVSSVKLAEVDRSNSIMHLVAAYTIARQLKAKGRLLPVDTWMLDHLEHRIAAERSKCGHPGLYPYAAFPTF